MWFTWKTRASIATFFKGTNNSGKRVWIARRHVVCMTTTTCKAISACAAGRTVITLVSIHFAERLFMDFNVGNNIINGPRRRANRSLLTTTGDKCLVLPSAVGDKMDVCLKL